MKKLFVILFVLLTYTAYAGDVKLKWTKTTSTAATGYKVYYGTASRTYTTIIPIGNVDTYTVQGLADGTYFFAVTARDDLGNESGFSNEVSKTIRTISPPSNLTGDIQITITISTP